MEELIEVVFEEEYKHFRVSELSNFLYYVKIVYTLLMTSPYLLEYKKEISINEVKKIAYKIKEEILSKKLIFPRYYYKKYLLFKKNLWDEDVFIVKIHKKSPLTIWFMGVTIFLTVCFALSGGEIEVCAVPPKIKIKMRSLGEGIKKIKEAMRY